MKLAVLAVAAVVLSGCSPVDDSDVKRLALPVEASDRSRTMSTANASWLYHHSRRGDVVRYIHSPRPLEARNGWTDWNVSWSAWLRGSALHRA